MILARTLAPIDTHGLALAIGNFDGLHCGHQALLAATLHAARQRGLEPAALSFHPMPREAFARWAGKAPPVRLMSVTEKLAGFTRLGVNRVLLPAFDRRFAAQSPAEFAAALQALKVRWVMVGADFRYGAKRLGDAATLRDDGARRGFDVEILDDVALSGIRVSSTGIRDALQGGRLDEAARGLGRRYAIVGRVTHGKKLGRTLGFPTLNVSLSRRQPALQGVYAVQCRLVTRGLEGVAGQGGEILNGVANLGTNPVVSSENRQHLEVFLFDFSGDLYGRRVEITFIEKIRDELAFTSLDGLVARMHDDVSEAQKILRTMNDGHQD